MDLHGVTGIIVKRTNVRKYAQGGEYAVRAIILRFGESEIELTLYSDSKECLRVIEEKRSSHAAV